MPVSHGHARKRSKQRNRSEHPGGKCGDRRRRRPGSGWNNANSSSSTTTTTTSKQSNNHQKRQRNHGRVEQSNGVKEDDSIEAQLLRQRQKQQQRQQNSDSNTPALLKDDLPPSVLGDYVYDPEKQAYFPASFSRAASADPCDESIGDECLTRESKYRGVKDIWYALQTCCSSSERQSLVSLWGGRCFLSGLQNDHVSTWRRASTDEPPFLYENPPWHRSLDALDDSLGNTSIAHAHGQEASLQRYNGKSPTISLHSTKTMSVRVFRQNRSSRTAQSVSDTFLACLHATGRHGDDGHVLFYNYHSFVLPDCVNAFDRLYDQDKIVVAMDRQQGRTLQTIDLEHGGIGPSRTVRSMPHSDALCVTAHPKDPHRVLFGHRNGQVALWDARSSDCAASTTTSVGTSRGVSIGSTTDLDWLSSHFQQDCFLVRGTNGVLQLVDLRNISTSSPTTKASRVHQKDRSIVHSWSTWTHDKSCHVAWTRRCKGMATNPSESVVMAPYIKRNGDASLSSWCLATGMSLGAKTLVQRQSTEATVGEERNSPGMSPDVELCCRTTVGIRRETHLEEDAPYKKEPQSYGLWFRCNDAQARSHLYTVQCKV